MTEVLISHTFLSKNCPPNHLHLLEFLIILLHAVSANFRMDIIYK